MATVSREMIAIGSAVLAFGAYVVGSTTTESKLLRAQSGRPLPSPAVDTKIPKKAPVKLPPLEIGVGGRHDML